MAICQLMVRDFMYGGHEDGYDEYDLTVGIDYAQSLIDEGHDREPFHKYDLRAFVAWAKEKMK